MESRISNPTAPPNAMFSKAIRLWLMRWNEPLCVMSGLRRLAQAADLYGGDHIGEDSTPGDGAFETLRFRPVEGGCAVVLVTSGNRSFVDHEARRELLGLLDRIDSDMSKRAGLGGDR
jgi:hypothetical protein